MAGRFIQYSNVDIKNVTPTGFDRHLHYIGLLLFHPSGIEDHSQHTMVRRSDDLRAETQKLEAVGQKKLMIGKNPEGMTRL